MSTDSSPYIISPDKPDLNIKLKNPEVKNQFDALPERDKIVLMKMLAENKAKKEQDTKAESKPESTVIAKNEEKEDLTKILQIEELPDETQKEKEDKSKESDTGTKTIKIA